jgi:hypothetical protein
MLTTEARNVANIVEVPSSLSLPNLNTLFGPKYLRAAISTRISQICADPVNGDRFEKMTASNARSNWLYGSKFLAASLRNGGT